MSKADIPVGIQYAIQRHTPQLEEVHFLPVPSGNQVIGIRQPNKRDSFFHPILLKA